MILIKLKKALNQIFPIPAQFKLKVVLGAAEENAVIWVEVVAVNKLVEVTKEVKVVVKAKEVEVALGVEEDEVY